MAKFILIDHSIVGMGGHHYEYAVRVLRAAAGKGFTPILATNRRFKSLSNLPWVTLPIYRDGFWPRRADNKLAVGIKGAFQDVAKLGTMLQATAVFSPIGLAWSSRNQMIDLVINDPRTRVRSLAAILPLAFLGYCFLLANRVAQFVSSLLPASAYFLRAGAAAAALLRAIIYPLRLASDPPPWMKWLLFNRRKAKAFGRDTRRLLKKIPLGESDIVFVPTLSESELLGLLDCFRLAASRKPRWNLLFRRSTFEGGEYGSLQAEAVRPMRNAFHAFATGLSGQKVYFHTDTEELTEQYDRLIGPVFDTLPIPVGADYFGREIEEGIGSNILRVVYLGDARHEKGFHHLPRVLQDIWQDYIQTGKVVFTIQSNFTSDRPDAHSRVALAQLEAMGQDSVRLIRNELNPQEYRDLVLSADVVLLPYDPVNYSARSSGVFVEALASGRPAIVPAGSWMAKELAHVTLSYLLSLHKLADVHVIKRFITSESRTGKRAMKGRPKRDHAFEHSEEDGFFERAVPKGTTHLRVSFSARPPIGGSLDHLVAEALFTSPRKRIRRVRMLCAGNGTKFAGVLALPESTQNATIRILPIHSQRTVAVHSFEIECLQAGRHLPLSCVGMAYEEAADISRCLREILDHYEHYRRSAHSHAKEWRRFHSAESLIEQLIDRSNT